MAIKIGKKIIRDYDEELYTNYGELPYLFEIQLGYGLIPRDEEVKNNLLKREISHCRNLIDAWYGVTCPGIHIKDSYNLEKFGYAIFVNGIETEKNSVRPGYRLCIDTGNVKTKLDCSVYETTKDPAYEMDACYIPEEEFSKYDEAGYVCVTPEKVIEAHLLKIIQDNITKILNQSRVNSLVEKVRKDNPDVISDIFFMHQFSMSDMKELLNQLLEEGVSIRDMNTILETIADNINQYNKIYELTEKVRQKLSNSIIQNYLDDNRVLHVFKLSKDVTMLLANKAYFPPAKNDRPCCLLNNSERKQIINAIIKALSCFNNRNLYPIFICVSEVRLLLLSIIHREQPHVMVISNIELYNLNKKIEISIEGEVTLND